MGINHVKYVRSNTNIVNNTLNTQTLHVEWLCCNKNYQKTFDENLKRCFANTYKFSHHDTNRIILLLLKKVYPYECMDDWERFDETSLPEK